MEKDFNADQVLSSLKPFQRDTVEHVFAQLYGDGSDEGSRRFLVSDETGLGKSIVARGLIAKTIEHLSNPEHQIPRIDVVYICSNQDLAKQNLKRLNVTGDEQVTVATRLSLLAKENHQLNDLPTDGRSKVNLVSFTPGTSFSEGGWRQGNADERALLVFLLDLISNGNDKKKRRATRRLLTGAVRTTRRFAEIVDKLDRKISDGYDKQVEEHFHTRISADGALAKFEVFRDEFLAHSSSQRWINNNEDELYKLIAELRSALSKAGVEALEPDLIILDEFQKFKHLLDPNGSEAAQLANELFQYKDVRVLMLSATPYKPFTEYGDDDDNHFDDFMSTIRFLSVPAVSDVLGSDSSDCEDPTGPLQSALRAYRESVAAEGPVQDRADEVRNLLLPVMSRAERPLLDDKSDLVQVRPLGSQMPTSRDIAEWASLARLSRAAHAPIGIEFWKSIPYFANFMDGYKIGSVVSDMLGNRGDHATIAQALESFPSLQSDEIRSFARVDLGNGHLRALAENTIDRGWWKLLWIPPSMPYLKPGKLFKDLSDGSVTKHVVFSAWSGVPTAIASLLSYEADRRAAGDLSILREYDPEARKKVSRRLQYKSAGDRAAAMSTLALFWPHAGLALRADELETARLNGGNVSSRTFATSFKSIGPRVEKQSWRAYFATPGSLPDELAAYTAEELAVVSQSLDDGEDDNGQESTTSSTASLAEHIREAMDLSDEHQSESVQIDSATAQLAAFSPGNIALRSIRSLAHGSTITKSVIWQRAFRLAEGLRSLFNRPETVALLTELYKDDSPYWRKVLSYCADGNLRSVLDEYLFQLHSETGSKELDDKALEDIVETAVGALTFKTANYTARTADAERQKIRFSSGFAVRYGSAQSSEGESSTARMSEVRGAFNSPFAPFVLASTSVGQEGIDFHWWSHSVVHWNVPSNPVDFEQREGRVNRFGGHAVRKNIAQKHWADTLDGTNPFAWRDASMAAEAEAEAAGLGDFYPWWMYPGDARINRIIAKYPLSKDVARYERLKDALVSYRLTLGQPRQEDMLELLEKRGINGAEVPPIDLRAPKRPAD